ncbi:hypothetical protein BB561_006855 [Smittium simulii]|uniref:Uncharacterized protein n=1 Tax=Smittium simulii TaxID=133385 RepID=A0A2T9Y0X8_9FUNG|nr:hypothetical protein BB561_006855 [Smittium simulii]
MLADAASSIITLRKELVYKIMVLPGRAQNLTDKTNDSLVEPEQYKPVHYPKRMSRVYSIGIQQSNGAGIQDQQQKYISGFDTIKLTFRNDNKFEINDLKDTLKKNL